MNIDLQGKRAAFRALHEQGCFVIPNPWDIGSVRRLEKLGFHALATTSAGYAWSRGREDGQLTRDGVLGHLRELRAATDLPITPALLRFSHCFLCGRTRAPQVL